MNYSNKEDLEQTFLFRWARFESGKYPELDLMYHIPNERKCSATAGAKLKAQGVKSGVPDICLPFARGKYHGMYIELKRETGSKTSDNQKMWIELLTKQGYYAVICKGWEKAMEQIVYYLNLK